MLGYLLRTTIRATLATVAGSVLIALAITAYVTVSEIAAALAPLF